LAVMNTIMNYLPKTNGKENGLKSRFCLSCKNDEMLLGSFWHNTVILDKIGPTVHYIVKNGKLKHTEMVNC